MSTATPLTSFRGHRTALLSTYDQDGTSVDTPVNIALDSGRVLFCAWEDSDRAQRLRLNPVADLRPCTTRGRPSGNPVHGRAQQLEGAEVQRAARILRRRHPMSQRWSAPISERLLRYRVLYYALTPDHDEEIQSVEGWPD